MFYSYTCVVEHISYACEPPLCISLHAGMIKTSEFCIKLFLTCQVGHMLKSPIQEIFEILIKDLNSAFVQEENSETEGQELIYSCEAQQHFQAV